MASECSEAALPAIPEPWVGGASCQAGGPALEKWEDTGYCGAGPSRVTAEGQVSGNTWEVSPTRNAAHALPAKTGTRSHLLSFQSPRYPPGIRAIFSGEGCPGVSGKTLKGPHPGREIRFSPVEEVGRQESTPL